MKFEDSLISLILSRSGDWGDRTLAKNVVKQVKNLKNNIKEGREGKEGDAIQYENKMKKLSKNRLLRNFRLLMEYFVKESSNFEPSKIFIELFLHC